MGIDKVPLNEMSQVPGEEVFRLGSVEISKGEYANAQKINQLIDEVRDLQERLSKVEGK